MNVWSAAIVAAILLPLWWRVHAAIQHVEPASVEARALKRAASIALLATIALVVLLIVAAIAHRFGIHADETASIGLF